MNTKPKGFALAIVPVVMAALAAAGVAMFEKQASFASEQNHSQQKFIVSLQNNLSDYYQAKHQYPINLNQVDAGRGVLVSAGLVPAEPGLTEPRWRYWSDGKSFFIYYFLPNNNVEQVISHQ
jgi:hypothetical protein